MGKKKITSNGLGMPGPTCLHQYVVGCIFKNYLMKYDGNHILMGVSVNKKPEIIPDLSVWEEPVGQGKDPKNPLLIIEVTRTSRNDKYSDGSIRRAFEWVPSLQEAFIYNFTEEKWIRYRVEKEEVIKEENKDFSKILSCHLSTLVKE